MRFHRLAALVAATAMLAGLAGNAMASEKNLRLVQLPISYSAVALLAEELGYTDVTVMTVPAGPDVVTALRSPSGADIGTIAVTPVVNMIGAGNNPLVIATMLQSDQQVSIVVSPTSKAADGSCNLRGQRVGYTSGTNGHIFLWRLLDKCGLKPTDVTLITGKPSDLVNLFVRGDLDVAILWDPFTQMAEKRMQESGKTARVYVRGDLHTLAFNIVTTREKLAGHEAEVKAFLAALIKVELYIQQHPAEAQALLEKKLGLQPGDLSHFFATTFFHVELNVPQMTKWLEEERAWLGTVADVKDTRTDMIVFIDASLLWEVDASRVTK
jgi:ABC-type nitrate/sulfonate/bicarbonate transport system substrate-binding protein